jgi:sarcosine oxidase subunit beta
MCKSTEDWMPIYDKSSLKGYYMAIGTSGNQFKNSGVAGMVMSELILSCQNGVDNDEIPLQVKLPRTNQLLNTAAFSRRRKVNLNSSMSVLA